MRVERRAGAGRKRAGRGHHDHVGAYIRGLMLVLGRVTMGCQHTHGGGAVRLPVDAIAAAMLAVALIGCGTSSESPPAIATSTVAPSVLPTVTVELPQPDGPNPYTDGVK